jgi:hypothetical protein
LREKITAYADGNPGPGLGQTQKCGSVKPVSRLPTFPSDIWISNDNLLPSLLVELVGPNFITYHNIIFTINIDFLFILVFQENH